MRIINLTKKQREKIANNLGKGLGKRELNKLRKIKKIVFSDKFIFDGNGLRLVKGKCPKCGLEMRYAGHFDCPDCGYSEYDEEKKKNVKKKKI